MLATVLLGWCSDKLDSEAIVEFVRALCAIAQEELDPAHAPRVYGLTKIVEISHFNMSRIRQAACTVPECVSCTCCLYMLCCLQCFLCSSKSYLHQTAGLM